MNLWSWISLLLLTMGHGPWNDYLTILNAIGFISLLVISRIQMKKAQQQNQPMDQTKARWILFGLLTLLVTGLMLINLSVMAGRTTWQIHSDSTNYNTVATEMTHTELELSNLQNSYRNTNSNYYKNQLQHFIDLDQIHLQDLDSDLKTNVKTNY